MNEKSINLPKLGLIAGGGKLPFELVNIFEQEQRPYVIAGINGFVQESLIQREADFFVDFGKVGVLIEKFRKLGVETLLLAGDVRRPTWRQLKPDFFAAKFLIKIRLKSLFRRRTLGDNALLEAAKDELSSYGFTVIGLDDLKHSLFVRQGPLGQVGLPTCEQNDLQLAIKAAKDLGQRDIGQAVIVSGGKVVALEDEGGTDLMLSKTQKSSGRLNGGLLLKAVKPQQDRRLDLPTIGPNTVKLAAELGLKAIAVESQGALVVQKQTCISLANSLDICLYGFEVAHEG